jgi:predicted MFS family arabinose efflux permease
LLLAALGVGTAAASLLAGRRTWQRPAAQRLAVLAVALAAALAGAAAVAEQPLALAGMLVLAGTALGAMFVTVYPLADALTPAGAGTRVFAWLVTANNGGVALGAALAGELHGGATGLWLASGFALAALPVAIAIELAGSHADAGQASRESAP